jgi:autotransporter-associated beta strand protein
MKINILSNKAYLPVILAGLLAPLFIMTSQASAATITWDGGGDGLTFTDATNWSGDVAPIAGDDLVFDADTSPKNLDGTATPLTNDFPVDTQFNSITFIGYRSPTQDNYKITGNRMEITSAITSADIRTDLLINNNVVVTSGDRSPDEYDVQQTLITGNVSGTGGFTVSNPKGESWGLYLSGTNTFSGDITVESGSLAVSNPVNAFGTSAGKTVIKDGANLGVTFYRQDYVTNEVIEFEGASHPDSHRGAKLSLDVGFGPLSEPINDTSIKFAGAVSTTSDLTVWSYGHDVTFSSLNLNGKQLKRAAGSFGNLTANKQKVAAPLYKETLTNSEPNTAVYVPVQSETTVNGVRGDVTVAYSGYIKGTGTVGLLDIAEGGFLAPGESPGCLSSSGLTLAGTFEAELAGTTVCTEYDQTDVTGTVDLTGGTLDVSLLNDFTPALNDTFIIINNDAADEIIGEFAGMINGSTFEVDGVTFRINYDGGDGNDVVLTATAVPAVPDTGSEELLANPLTTLVMGLAAVTMLGGYKLSQKRK